MDEREGNERKCFRSWRDNIGSKYLPCSQLIWSILQHCKCSVDDRRVTPEYRARSNLYA